MRILALCFALSAIAACSGSSSPAPANATPAAPALIEIPPAPDQQVSRLEKSNRSFTDDLDAIVERGYLRILVSPSRAHFETVEGRHRGRAVDAGVALARAVSENSGKTVQAVFIETHDDQLIPSLLAGKGDVAANLMLTIARDEQVAFASPVRKNIRELIVTDVGVKLVSLEDVGGRTIHVRRNSDHHASLIRLNDQLTKISRRPALIAFDTRAKTDEDLLDSVNAGRIRATIVDDYILDRWQKDLLKVASANRDIAVSQDGILAWATRKDAPKLLGLLNEFFAAHQLTM